MHSDIFDHYLIKGSKFGHKINELIRTNGLPRPRWSSVRCIMLANTRNINNINEFTCSSTMASISIKDRCDSFKELLESRNGRIFFDFLYSSIYENIMKDTTIGGSDIWDMVVRFSGVGPSSDKVATGLFYPSLEYANASKKSSFLKTASSVNEVKLALMQSWHIMSDHLSNVSNKREYGRDEIEGAIEYLTYKALNLGIDVMDMKEKVINFYKRISNAEKLSVVYNFGEVMEKEGVNIWVELETITERNKLEKTVSNKSNDSTRRIIGSLTL